MPEVNQNRKAKYCYDGAGVSDTRGFLGSRVESIEIKSATQ